MVSKCKIWIAKQFSNIPQIFYSDSYFNESTDNSYNECIYVEDDGFNMGFKATLFDSHNLKIKSDQYLPALVIEHYLWRRFTKRLED